MEPIASPIPLDELLGHRAWVRALAHGIARDAAGADDLEQETWLAALERPPTDRDTVRGWFATVARNAARDRGRSESRRARREEAVAHGRDRTAENAADVVARAESHKRVVLAVMDLPEPQRTTILLRFFEGLPPRDVAARMECPVETVRTRTRRALAELRARLGGDSGDGWRAALVPLLAAPAAQGGAGTEPAVAAGGGGGRMLHVKIAAVAAALLAAPVAYLLLQPDGAPPPRGPAPRVVADADSPPPRRRVEPPGYELAPGDGEPDDAGSAGGTTEWPRVRPLPPEEDASVFADGRLTMRVAVDPPVPRAGEPFRLVVTFGNAGTGPLRFHVPEFAGAVPFPRLELRGADGKLSMPVAATFQSEWEHGLHGDVIRLEPGEEHSVASDVVAVADLEGDPAEHTTGRFAATQKQHAVAPGDYTVTAVLANDRPVVPWGEPNFVETEKEVPGLWTGELRSTPIAIRVAPPDEPMLALDAPEKLVPGASATLTLTISNPSRDDRVLRGAFALRRTEKGGPGYVAWFEPGERATPCAPDPGRELTLAPGETRTCTLDMGALIWSAVSDRGPPFRRGTWPFEREYPALWVTCGERDADGAENVDGMLGSNTLYRPLEPAPDLAPRGMTLHVDAGGLADEPPHVLLRLRNEGSEELVVPLEFAARGRVRLTVTTSGDRPRTVSVLLAGARDRALRATDLTTLGPGDELVAHVPLVDGAWARDVAPGTHVLRAAWANADAGDREGMALRPVVGRVTSAPADVVVPAR